MSIKTRLDRIVTELERRQIKARVFDATPGARDILLERLARLADSQQPADSLSLAAHCAKAIFGGSPDEAAAAVEEMHVRAQARLAELAGQGIVIQSER